MYFRRKVKIMKRKAQKHAGHAPHHMGVAGCVGRFLLFTEPMYQDEPDHGAAITVMAIICLTFRQTTPPLSTVVTPWADENDDALPAGAGRLLKAPRRGGWGEEKAVHAGGNEKKGAKNTFLVSLAISAERCAPGDVVLCVARKPLSCEQRPLSAARERSLAAQWTSALRSGRHGFLGEEDGALASDIDAKSPLH